MSRYRLYPTPAQEMTLREYCAHARFAWNLCVEQQSWWRPGRGSPPGAGQRSRQLTEARAEFDWLRAVPRVVQAQALRDFDQTMGQFFGGLCGRPTWRKAGRSEGFRVHDSSHPYAIPRRLNRRWGEVQVPKVGWVRFRWSRPVPPAKSYRITCDRAGRWHVAFTVIPKPLAGPGTGEVVGIDRGVAVSAALSTGEQIAAPRLNGNRQQRLRRLQRQASRRCRRGCPGSARLRRTRRAIAQLKVHETDARKDWVEKVSTDLAQRFDVIRVEDLRVQKMTRSAKGTTENPGRNVRQKAGLNREILASGWGMLVDRLTDKAPSRVEKVNPAFTSQRCSACGHVHAKSRKSQADFACTACGYACNADVNAAKNIAAGYAVNARGGDQVAGPVNREPQHGSPMLESAA